MSVPEETVRDAEAFLRDKYPDDALDRLVRSNYDYYSTHGDYLPELARLLLIERDELRAVRADNERLREDVVTALVQISTREYWDAEQILRAALAVSALSGKSE